jgi:hypothetical protein
MKIELPTTPEDWCRYFRRLDFQFKTDVRSPLHHDSRCAIHTTDPAYKGREYGFKREEVK